MVDLKLCLIVVFLVVISEVFANNKVILSGGGHSKGSNIIVQTEGKKKKHRDTVIVNGGGKSSNVVIKSCHGKNCKKHNNLVVVKGGSKHHQGQVLLKNCRGKHCKKGNDLILVDGGEGGHQGHQQHKKSKGEGGHQSSLSGDEPVSKMQSSKPSSEKVENVHVYHAPVPFMVHPLNLLLGGLAFDVPTRRTNQSFHPSRNSALMRSHSSLIPKVYPFGSFNPIRHYPDFNQNIMHGNLLRYPIMYFPFHQPSASLPRTTMPFQFSPNPLSLSPPAFHYHYDHHRYHHYHPESHFGEFASDETHVSDDLSQSFATEGDLQPEEFSFVMRSVLKEPQLYHSQIPFYSNVAPQFK